MSGRPEPDEAGSGLDIRGNRAASKWTTRELLARFAWEYLGAIIFRLTPRPLWGARRTILRIFGAEIANGVHIFPNVRIAIPWHLSMGEFSSLGDRAIVYNLGKITIGARATVSQYAHLCAGTHDHRVSTFDLLKPPIAIGPDAWICADAFVGPGVSVGAGAIVAARAVAVRDVADRAVVAGNPARSVKKAVPET